MGSAPADGISIGVKCHWPTRPETARASHRRRNRITRIGHIAGLHNVSRAVSIGYGTPTTAPAITPAATPTPTAQPQQRASAGGAANRETATDVAAANASKDLFIVVAS